MFYIIIAFHFPFYRIFFHSLIHHKMEQIIWGIERLASHRSCLKYTDIWRMPFALSQEVCTCYLDTRFTFNKVRVKRVPLHRQKMANLSFWWLIYHLNQENGYSHSKAPNCCFFILLETCVVSIKVCQTNINSYFN